MPRGRILSVMQYVYNDFTKEQLISEDIIKYALTHKTITEYAYILHDKDKYSIDDEQNDKDRLSMYYDLMHNADFVSPEDDKFKDSINNVLIMLPQIRHGNKEQIDNDVKEMEKEDFVNKYLYRIYGKDKPLHFHIVLKCKNTVHTSQIAKWFHIKENYVEIIKGSSAFPDAVRYLTHENETCQMQGKYRYSDEEVKCNFNLRDSLSRWFKDIDKYGKMLNQKEKLRMMVFDDGVSLREISFNYPLDYSSDFHTLAKLRQQYLSLRSQMPPIRLNFYISGESGVGKGLLSRALARQLYKLLGGQSLYDDDMYFTVGSKKSSLTGYDGQPVVIWDDFRGDKLVETLGSAPDVFKVFDMFPIKANTDVKFGAVSLVNSFNIVNGIDSYKTFMAKVSGQYFDIYHNEHFTENPEQIYRRFPFIIEVKQDTFDLLMNSGVLNDNRDFQSYVTFRNIQANFKRIAQYCQNDIELRNKAETMALELPIQTTSHLRERVEKTLASENDDIFNGLGQIKEPLNLSEWEQISI